MLLFRDEDLAFMSDDQIETILRSTLLEISATLTNGAFRSATYLAASAMEGLLIQVIELLKLDSTKAPNWPQKSKKDIPADGLSFGQAIKILQDVNKLPKNFEDLFEPVSFYRNYMHPRNELRHLTDMEPIKQSVALMAVACLVRTLEEFAPMRVFANCNWHLEYGYARVSSFNSIRMLDDASQSTRAVLVVCEPGTAIPKEISFVVHLSEPGIFNFIYNYSSRQSFRAARIDTRKDYRGGLLVCNRWGKWTLVKQYELNLEPNHLLVSHEVHIILLPSFQVLVDGIALHIEAGANWDFSNAGQFGFMTEWADIAISDIELLPQ